MNLFLLSWDPGECARWHCDKHVGKMLLELCQMMYTAWWINCPEQCETWNPPKTLSGKIGYKKISNHNHPMAKWVRECRANYLFTGKLALNLAVEFFERRGKNHSCAEHALWLFQNLPTFEITSKCLTKVPQCMPEEYYDDDPVIAYRNYYIGDKARFAKWPGDPPHWWIIKNTGIV